MTALASDHRIGAYLAGEGCSVWWPHVLPSNPVPVVWCHSSSGLSGGYFQSPFNDEPRALAEAGFVVAAPDLTGPNVWGNQASVNALSDCITYLRSKFGADPDRVILVGASMGFTMATAWLDQNPAGGCIGLGFVVPACDMVDLHDNRGFATQIDTAYGSHANYLAALPDHNPVQLASGLNVPIQLWSASDDTVCIPSTIAAFDAAAPNCTVVNMGAVGHDVSALAGSTLATWAQSLI